MTILSRNKLLRYRLQGTFSLRALFAVVAILAVGLGIVRYRSYRPADPVRRALERPCAIKFNNVPLDEAVAELSRRCGVQIHLDARGLADAAVSPDTPTSLDLAHGNVDIALNLILDPLDLDWVVDGDSILVSSREVLDEREEVRFHDISWLPELLPTTTYLGRPSTQSRAQFCCNAFISLIERDSWGDGNPFTSFKFVNEKGLVYFPQLARAHDNIDALLAALRQALKDPDQTISAALPQYLEREAAISKALDKRISVDFDDRALTDALRDLRTRLGIEIQLDSRGIVDADVSATVPINIRAESLPLRTILARMLEPLSLAAAMDRGVLMVTSKGKADEVFRVVIYPISDFLPAGTGNHTPAYDLMRAAADNDNRICCIGLQGFVICSASDAQHYKISKALRDYRAAVPKR